MYISSDTNIWFDFEAIGFPEHPFLLDNEYYLSDVTYHDEIQYSEGLTGTVRRYKNAHLSGKSLQICLLP